MSAAAAAASRLQLTGPEYTAAYVWAFSRLIVGLTAVDTDMGGTAGTAHPRGILWSPSFNSPASTVSDRAGLVAAWKTLLGSLSGITAVAAQDAVGKEC